MIQAWAVAVPLLCCSAPRAVRIIADRAAARVCTVSRIASTGTPVIRSTRSGQEELTPARTAAKPVVRSAT